MKPSEPQLPLEKMILQEEVNGTVKNVPCLDKTWVNRKKRQFSTYVSHPVPVGGRFVMGEKDSWLELAGYVRDDLEWLLKQKHHVFWSHMIFSKDAQRLMITFLQEAPPYYSRSEFPKDRDMEEALERIEKLVFLVFLRLTTRKESKGCFVENIGKLLYDNYVITVPILLDICLIYGVSNRELVAKMLDDVISAAPQYLSDFKEVVPHFLHVLSLAKNEFDRDQMLKLRNCRGSKLGEMRDVALLLHDATANVHIFLEVYPKGSKLFRVDAFAGEVSSFYSQVIPVVYDAVKNYGIDPGNEWDLVGKIERIRLDLLSTVRSVLCGIINEAFDDVGSMRDHANDYMTKMIEILQDGLFISDYNRMYPIDADMKMLMDACQDMDPENVSYISEAVASFSQAENVATRIISTERKELESAVEEVRCILPHLGHEFVRACLRYYDMNTERTVASIMEERLPPELEGLDREPNVPRAKPSETGRKMDRETFDLLNDKREINEMRERFSHLSLVESDEYDDEYDDTYDGQDVSVREADDSEEKRRPFVTPRVLRRGEDDDDDDDGSGGEDDSDREEPRRKEGDRDWFVPNPAEVREMQERRRMERARRGFAGRGRGRGTDRQVVANREFKESHKSSMANHNRRKLASRKRNLPFLHS